MSAAAAAARPCQHPFPGPASRRGTILQVETLDWAPTRSRAAGSGDLGWTVGAADPSGDLTFFSKYVTLWLRQPDGLFRYEADGGNAAPGR